MVTAAELLACQQAVREVHVDERCAATSMEIVHDTREHDDVSLGGSPRASLALFRTAQALAAISGRNFVLPDDVKQLAAAGADASPDPAARKPAAQGDGRRRWSTRSLTRFPCPAAEPIRDRERKLVP